MEKRLKFNLMLSLKEMALRRVTVLLSNDYKIRFSVLSSEVGWKIWRNTHEDKVKYKISRLLIPELLKKEMIAKVRPISSEIRKYLAYLFTTPYIFDICAEKFYWTTAGTIDFIKSAESFLGGKVFSVKGCYELACRHCLEDYIPLLWDELSEHEKELYRSKIHVSSFPAFWPHLLKGEFSELDCLWTISDKNLTSFNQWAFEDAGRKGNKTAAEFFFRKLTHKERKVSVMRTTLVVLSCLRGYFQPHYDALCYLLSLMTPEQQVKIIKKEPVHILLYFLKLPWQDLFVENISLIWSFLPTSRYYELLLNILKIVRSDDCYPKFFHNFFKTSPLDFKKYFLHNESFGSSHTPGRFFLGVFIRRNDSYSIESVFRNLDSADRVALVFQPACLDYFCRSVRKKGTKSLMVKVCLREAQLSKEDRKRLKKERPHLRRVIKELYESKATAENEMRA